MNFEKWQALGNDYVILEAGELPWALTAARVRRLCEPHTGIGCDGILLVSEPGRDGAIAGLRIFNPDGSESGLSGNGSREAALYLYRHGRSAGERFSISTPAGEIRVQVSSPTSATLELGRARLRSDDYPDGAGDGRGRLAADQREWDFQHVNVGNPQCAIAVASAAELKRLDPALIGPGLERHPAFPNRTNVSWYTALAPDRIRARIFERGVGETASSGTG
ncbi:MAG: diaminopimelate epimerase, partial [Solirubrobacteraceae bacterium]